MACCKKLKSMACCKKIQSGISKLSEFKVYWDFFTLILYIIDILTDCFAAVSYINGGDVVWGWLGVTFIILPIAFTSPFTIIFWLIDDSFDVCGLPKCVIGIGLLCLFPAVPFLSLVRGVVKGAKGTANGDSNGAMRFTKTLESILESLPQSCLQMYVLFQYMQDPDKVIHWWQWVSLSVSLLTLAISIANSMFFEDAATSSKAAIGIFGLISVTSRLLVCCLFSLIINALWFVPFATYLTMAITMWLVKLFNICPESLSPEPLNAFPHRDCNPFSILLLPLVWVLSSLFNTFTYSGLPIAFVNLCLAVTGYYVSSYPVVAIVAMTFSGVNFLANIILVKVPAFKDIGEVWIIGSGNEDGSDFY